jgi:SAM-dependent methyltransferase
MAAYEFDLPASDDCLDEAAYLLANPDVAHAVRAGQLVSGRQNFDLYGRSESPPRRMRMTARIHDGGSGKRRWWKRQASRLLQQHDELRDRRVRHDDVVGVGEELPFADEFLDTVISNAVLEHVKDPFRYEREMAHVLKPGGELFCAVPLLQPVHGYPHRELPPVVNSELASGYALVARKPLPGAP